MNICVTVIDCYMQGDNIRIHMHVHTSQGHDLSTDAVVAFSAAAATVNNAIATAARDMLRGVLGLTIAANEPVRIFGGAV